MKGQAIITVTLQLKKDITTTVDYVLSIHASSDCSGRIVNLLCPTTKPTSFRKHSSFISQTGEPKLKLVVQEIRRC